MTFFLTTKLGRYLATAIAALALLGAAYWWIERQGYQRALDAREKAAEQAKERADDIRNEVDRRDDDALVDGILRD